MNLKTVKIYVAYEKKSENHKIFNKILVAVWTYLFTVLEQLKARKSSKLDCIFNFLDAKSASHLWFFRNQGKSKCTMTVSSIIN